MGKSPLLVQSISIDKTQAQRPGRTQWVLGVFWPQANVLGISEQIGAPEVQCTGFTGVWTRIDAHNSNPHMWADHAHYPW